MKDILLWIRRKRFEREFRGQVKPIEKVILNCYRDVGHRVLRPQEISGGVQERFPGTLAICVTSAMNSLLKKGKIRLVCMPDNRGETLAFRIL